MSVHKQRSGASAVLDRIAIPADAHQVLLHVRDYTKGHPQIAANNHPVRHGVGRRRPQRHDPQRRRADGAARLRARRARDDRRLRGDLRHRRGKRQRRPRASRTSAARWRQPGSTNASRTCSISRAASAGRSGSAPAAASSSSPPPSARSRSPSVHRASSLRKRELAEGTLLAFKGPRAVRRRALQARSDLRGRPAAGRSRTRRGRVLPPAARRVSPPASRASPSPSRSTVTPSSRRRSRTRYWNVDHAPRRASNMPVDLPLGQERRVLACAPRPSR